MWNSGLKMRLFWACKSYRDQYTSFAPKVLGHSLIYPLWQLLCPCQVWGELYYLFIPSSTSIDILIGPIKMEMMGHNPQFFPKEAYSSSFWRSIYTKILPLCFCKPLVIWKSAEFKSEEQMLTHFRWKSLFSDL